MSDLKLIYFTARCAVSMTCFISAATLIVLGRDEGWGWLILAGVICSPSEGP